MEKYLMEITGVYALLALIGMDNGANQMDAQVVKSGMEVAVLVKMDIILMVPYVCFVSMAKYGIRLQILVIAQLELYGMEIFAKKLSYVLAIGSLMKQFNNAYAQQINFGMDIVVW